MGEPKWFLGIRIIRDRNQRKIWLCQDSYIEKMATQYQRTHTQVAHFPSTPISTQLPGLYDSIATPLEIYEFQKRTGSMTYSSAITRPDIAFATKTLVEAL